MKIEKLPRDFVYTDRRTLDDFIVARWMTFCVATI